MEGWYERRLTSRLEVFRTSPGEFDDDLRRPCGRLVGMMPYERLKAWQSCHQLTIATYRITNSFPKSELYGLVSQMRRAAFSAAANLAEGSAKRGPREFRRFLDTTLGSLSEMSYAIMVVRELGFVSEAEWKELNDLRAQAGRLTWGLYRLIRSKETTART